MEASKGNLRKLWDYQKTPFFKGLLIASFYSYLPLILDPSSFPPGEDAFRLSSYTTWQSATYYGWIPQIYLGITFYYYSTFLLMYIGLWFLLKDIHRWAGLTTWAVLLFLAPTVYVQMFAGNWLTIVGFFFMVIIPVKLYSRWIQTRKIETGILAITLASLAQFFHTETGAYLIVGLSLFFLVSFKWYWRFSWGVIPPILAFLIIATTGPIGTADQLLNKILNNDGKTTYFDSRIYGEEGGGVIRLETVAGNTIWQDITPSEKVKLVTGGTIIIDHPQQGLITVGISKFEIIDNPLPPSTVRVSIVKMDLGTFATDFLGTAMSTVIIVVTALLFISYYRRQLKRLPNEIYIISAMLPLMIFFTFSPYQISLSRIAIHIVSIMAIFLGVGIIKSLETHTDAGARIALLAVIAFMVQQNSINTLGLWILARA